MTDVGVVMGAGPGLGRAVALQLAARGTAVALLARSADRLAVLAAETRQAGAPEALPVPVDLASEASVRQAFGVVRDGLGEPGVLVHNPSVTIEAPATRTPYEGLMTALSVTVGSLLVAAQEVAPGMVAAGRGTILVTGSRAALAGSTWSAAVGVQKAAVRNLVQSLALELGPQGVHVATVTVMGTLGRPGFDVEAIAAEFASLVAETDGPPERWRTEVPWDGTGAP